MDNTGATLTVDPQTILSASHVILPGHRNRLGFDREAGRALFTFGRWVFLSTMLMYLTSYTDRLILSKLMPRDVAGAYGIAVMIAAIAPRPSGTASCMKRPRACTVRTATSKLMAPLATNAVYSPRL